MQKINFKPFRTGEYRIDSFLFSPGYNEVPDAIAETQPYQELLASQAVEPIVEQEPVKESEGSPLEELPYLPGRVEISENTKKKGKS